MSCVYWEPKSRMSTVECMLDYLFNMIIGRFLGNLYIMNMRFTYTCRSNFDKFSLVVHILNSAATEIAHTRTYSPHQLVNNIGQCTFVGNPSFHAFRHQLLIFVTFSFLKVAITGSLLHGRQ